MLRQGKALKKRWDIQHVRTSRRSDIYSCIGGDCDRGTQAMGNGAVATRMVLWAEMCFP